MNSSNSNSGVDATVHHKWTNTQETRGSVWLFKWIQARIACFSLLLQQCTNPLPLLPKGSIATTTMLPLLLLAEVVEVG